MKLQLNKQAFEGEWFDFNDELKLFIKPVGYFDIEIPSALQGDADRQKAAEISMLTKALVDWKGVEDDGKPVECNDEAKRIALNHYPSIRNFVAEKMLKLQNKIEEELKN